MVSFRGVPAYNEGCLGSESALKTHRPRRWGRWAEILLFGKSPGSWLGVGSVVVELSFRGGESDALGRGLLVTVGEFSDMWVHFMGIYQAPGLPPT